MSSLIFCLLVAAVAGLVVTADVVCFRRFLSPFSADLIQEAVNHQRSEGVERVPQSAESHTVPRDERRETRVDLLPVCRSVQTNETESWRFCWLQ